MIFQNCRTKHNGGWALAGAVFFPIFGCLCLFCFLVMIKAGIQGATRSIVLQIMTTVASLLGAGWAFLLGKNSFFYANQKAAFSNTGFAASEQGQIHPWSEVGEISIIIFGATSGKMVYETEVCISRQPLTKKDLRRLCGSYVYGISNQKRFLLLDYSEALLQEIQDLSGLPIIDHRPEQLK